MQEGTTLTIHEIDYQNNEIMVTKVDESFQVKGIEGKIHSALIRQKKEGKWMMILDNKNFYLINLITKDVKIIKGK